MVLHTLLLTLKETFSVLTEFIRQAQGYGIIANEFIKAINEECNAQIPLVDVSTIPGSLVFEAASKHGKIWYSNYSVWSIR